MRSENEKEYLFKAIDAFQRRLVVVSPEFKILAASCKVDGERESEFIGKVCYELFSNRSSPCENCAGTEALGEGKTALKPKPEDNLDLERMPCYYAYPLFKGKDIEAFVSMDFDLPTKGGIEEKLQRSKAFLRNIILSSVDGVIANDRTGKILIFNEAAADIF